MQNGKNASLALIRTDNLNKNKPLPGKARPWP
jgi:hypothetical protein